MQRMNAIVLAGGKSRRFGSDKSLISINGMPLISHMTQLLSSSFDKVYVSLSPKNDYSFLKNVNFVYDDVEGLGPLGGLQSALQESDADLNFLCGCDMPHLSPAFFQLLRRHPQNYDVLIPKHDDFFEPLAAVYHKRCLEGIHALMQKKDYKIVNLFDYVEVKTLLAKDMLDIEAPSDLFFNINYTKDLSLLQS